MSRQQHSIQKLTVDIRFPSGEKAYALQDRISDLYRNRLKGVLEEVLDELIPGDMIVRFDTLPLDLGMVILNRIEEDIPEKLKWSLGDQLSRLLSVPESVSGLLNGDPRFSSFRAGYVEVMEYFLVTGSLPWWAVGEQTNDPAKLLELILREHAAAFKLALMRIGQFSYVRRRIAYQFSESALRSVIEILEPEQAAFIFEYHRSIIAAQEEEQPVKTEAAELKKAVYEFILTYLLVDRGNDFNRKDFVKSTLTQMAGHFNLQYVEILNLFASPLIETDTPAGRAAPLAVIIRELFAEQQTGFHQAATAPRMEEQGNGAVRPETIALTVERIRYYFFFGSFPPAAGEYDEVKLRSDFLMLINTVPEAARRLITGLRDRPGAIRRMVWASEPEGTAGIIRLMEPAYADFILSWLRLAALLQQKTAIASSGEKLFRGEPEELALGFLLTAQATAFDARAFLEANIREISRRYNIPFNIVIAMLIQATGEESKTPADTGIFHLLTDLLRGLRESPRRSPGAERGDAGIPEKDQAQGMPGKDKEDFLERRSLVDLMRFWLQYGYLPWWAKDQPVKSPVAIWEKLVAGNPSGISWLMKYAGTEEQMKQRLAWQLPRPLLLEAFRLFPEGHAAVALLEPLVQLLENIPELRLRDRNLLTGLMVIALWDGFIQKGYREFSVSAFVLRSIRQLSYWTGIYPAEIYRLMLKTFFRGKGKIVYPESLADAVGSFTGKKRQSLESGGWEQEEQEGGADIRLMIDHNFMPATEGPSQEEAISGEGLRILEYYLRHHELPGRLTGISPALRDIFLQKLLRLLFREKRERLKLILQNADLHPAAAIHIHDIIYEDQSGHSEGVKDLLSSFRERDLLRYLESLAGEEIRAGSRRVGEILEMILQSSSGDIRKHLIANLLNSPLLAGLLAEKLGEAGIYRLAGQAGWSKAFLLFLEQWYRFFAGSVKDLPDKLLFLAWFRRLTLSFLSAMEDGNSVEKYLQEFLSGIVKTGFPSRAELYGALLEAAQRNAKDSGSPLGSLMPGFTGRLKQLKAGEAGRAKIKKELKTSDEKMLEQTGFRRRGPGYIEEAGKIAAELAGRQRSEESAKRDGLKRSLKAEEATAYIKNAGLVLLHPFLFTYYTRLGLMEKTEFVSEEARQRAAHLLQYLVDETMVHPEQEMVLNKILCGMEPEDPLTLEIAVTPREAEVSQELMRVVTTRWEKMKNTSLQGFRASFLQREGALFPMDTAWKLRVDQRGYDILLQTLPWTFGMVRASWMKKIIYVEWI